MSRIMSYLLMLAMSYGALTVLTRDTSTRLLTWASAMFEPIAHNYETTLRETSSELPIKSRATFLTAQVSAHGQALGGESRQLVGQVECPLGAELRPSRIDVAAGERAMVEVRFVNRSNKQIDVFNPKLNPLLSPWSRATVLAILRDDGTYVGDLLYRTGGSSTPPTRLDWQKLEPGEAITTSFTFWAGIVPNTTYFHTGNLLPPGKYFLEIRVHDRVLSRPPLFVTESIELRSNLNHPTYSNWMLGFPGQEICRSNRVALEINQGGKKQR